MSIKSPIWRIKYFPKTLEEVCNRKEIKDTLQGFIKSKNFPHLLFVGPGSSGKTTLARLFCKSFLGDLFEPNFKLVYADVPLTDEERKQARSEAYVSTSKIGSIAGKTITTPAFLQVKIKPFVQIKALGGAPFKILIVKNFEVLGSNQQGFRRLMESYGTNCRMIIITTKISGIIDPILSRCQIFMISPIDYNSFKKLILKISKEESLIIEEESTKLLYQMTEGKISKAVDLLQLCSIKSKNIDLNALYDNFTSSKEDLIRSLLLISLKGDFLKARALSRKIQANYRYSPHEIFSFLLNEVFKLPLSQFSKFKLTNFIAEADFRALEGLDTDIQISNLIAQVCHFSEFM